MIELNGKPINVTMFPDKTSQVWKLENLNFNVGTQNVVNWYFEQESELFHLLQLNDLMTSKKFMPPATLNIPYLPYARQDKPQDNEQTFALWSFTHVMNLMYWHQVNIFDAHSAFFIDYYGATAQRTQSVNNIEPDPSGFIDEYDIVCLPDHGALTRYEHLFPGKQLIYGMKERDPSTGWITHYELSSGEVTVAKNPDNRILVFDDLCDGGLTFNILVKSLGWVDKKPDLYVSHGLFSKGVHTLLENYGKIITTDSCCCGSDICLYPHTLSGKLVIKNVMELMEKGVAHV